MLRVHEKLQGLGFIVRVSGFEFRISGFGFRVSGFGFRVSVELHEAPRGGSAEPAQVGVQKGFAV